MTKILIIEDEEKLARVLELDPLPFPWFFPFFS
ncbi:hypothetical protein SAMN05216179_0337 [Gracilibacillus kekensis]|uniref:Uncharacterized protein n=1 Tax=Gracilibacillus kekensis TaxID=1027249 RepID=A0A1M7JEF8_9BACI|nr:hypothetical protein SAMN05216179_0337 [Gracilibacillus kekensis]